MIPVDIVVGPYSEGYVDEVVRRLSSLADVRVLRSKSYSTSVVGSAYRLVDHPYRLWLERRSGSVLHIGSQLLAHVLAFPSASPTVVTCYDLVPFLSEFDDPSYVWRSRPFDSLYFRLLARGLRRADRVVAVSEFVRRDLVRMGIDASRIKVLPYGVDTEVFRPLPREECLEVLRTYGVPRRQHVLLFVGTEHPRKNIKGLFEAFARLPKELDAVLVKVGAPRSPQRHELRALVAALGLDNQVVFVDRVAEEDMPKLYCAADAVVLPSFHEGFGLPPLEAAACGTPTAVSNVTSLPEVMGKASLYFDPGDAAQISDAMVRLLTDGILREELRARGLERASEFDWDRTTEGLLGVYRELVASG